jgi:16S rRNA processing protein RimM
MLPAWEPAELPADAVEVGRILDAWGLKGWFKVLPHSASPEALFSSKRWFLQPSERGAKTFSGTVLLKIKEAKDHSDSVVATSPEVPDRNTAELLKGARIFVSRASFPTPEADEYYWVDLIGLDVINREGLSLGTVRDLMTTGPQAVLCVEYQNVAEDGTSSAAERMIPFVAAYVDAVDVPGKRITVDWQPDY